MSECLDLVSFAEGELEPARAEVFRAHLPTCEACQAGLVDAMQLSAHLSTLMPPPGRPATPPARTASPVHRWTRPALHAAAAIAPVAAYVLLVAPHLRPAQVKAVATPTQ